MGTKAEVQSLEPTSKHGVAASECAPNYLASKKLGETLFYFNPPLLFRLLRVRAFWDSQATSPPAEGSRSNAGNHCQMINSTIARRSIANAAIRGQALMIRLLSRKRPGSLKSLFEAVYLRCIVGYRYRR